MRKIQSTSTLVYDVPNDLSGIIEILIKSSIRTGDYLIIESEEYGISKNEEMEDIRKSIRTNNYSIPLQLFQSVFEDQFSGVSETDNINEVIEHIGIITLLEYIRITLNVSGRTIYGLQPENWIKIDEI